MLSWTRAHIDSCHYRVTVKNATHTDKRDVTIVSLTRRTFLTYRTYRSLAQRKNCRSQNKRTFFNFLHIPCSDFPQSPQSDLSCIAEPLSNNYYSNLTQRTPPYLILTRRTPPYLILTQRAPPYLILTHRTYRNHSGHLSRSPSHASRDGFGVRDRRRLCGRRRHALPTAARVFVEVSYGSDLRRLMDVESSCIFTLL